MAGGCVIRVLTYILSLRLICCSVRPEKQPHIVVIVADDLGWNDVGFHGSVQTPTPNIDALAYSGIILNRHYVQPTCTPSRAALLTGRYPIRYGLQGTPIKAGQASAIPLNETLLPQYFKDLGYSTHLVGKWHLGSYEKRYTPTRRGFDSHFGYWNGYISYRNSVHSTDLMSGTDARRGLERAGNEMVDRYATDVFTEEARRVIKSCKTQRNPMFLMVSHLAVHSGNPGPDSLEVSNKTNNDMRFNYIENEGRRLYAGMLSSLDVSVGNIIESLDENEMLQDSVILFLSDNGAPTDDPIWGHGNFGSNWPLRGEKGSVLDGGVRGVAAIWSPLLKEKHSISENLFHITDWLPTLYSAAGGDLKHLGQIDGIDQWKSLTDTSEQIRSVILINIDEKRGEEALIFNQWKVVKSNRSSDTCHFLRYSGDPGDRGPEYNASDAVESMAGSRLSKINCRTSARECTDPEARRRLFGELRSRARIDGLCAERIADEPSGYECFDEHCLFDVRRDPCERRNVARDNPSALNAAADLLERFRRQTVRQNRPGVDPRADPRLNDGYWDAWMDRRGVWTEIRSDVLTLVNRCRRSREFVVVVPKPWCGPRK